MKNRNKILIAALAATGIARAALAHGTQDGHGPRAERMFERMDTDGDGRVSRADATAFAAARFARMDANGDGQISQDERRAARQARRGERLARMDANGDGQLSREEMRAAAGERAERRFARLDTDGDGSVSLTEMADMRGKRGGGRHQDQGRMGKHGPATQAMVEERVLKRFDRMDVDQDGVITLEDVRAARP